MQFLRELKYWRNSGEYGAAATTLSAPVSYFMNVRQSHPAAVTSCCIAMFATVRSCYSNKAKRRMAQRDRPNRITPSVLDRLLDDMPAEVIDPPAQISDDFERFKASVRRDLESLLNTRRESMERLEAFPEAQASILTYGLPDFTNLSSQSDVDRASILETVERTIAVFEPRLMNVAVTLSSSAESRQQLAFRVDALLRVDPVPAAVTFDAVLQLSTQTYKVKS